jgi:hypothetical protein
MAGHPGAPTTDQILPHTGGDSHGDAINFNLKDLDHLAGFLAKDMPNLTKLAESIVGSADLMLPYGDKSQSAQV